MEYKGFFLLVVVCVVVCCVQGFPSPRDSTVIKTEDVVRAGDSAIIPAAKRLDQVQTTTMKTESDKKIHSTTDKNEIITPHQVSCNHEEATDDLVCQEHCLPKGYSYGLCVSYKCSCI